MNGACIVPPIPIHAEGSEARQAGHFHGRQQSATGSRFHDSNVGAYGGGGSMTGRYLVYTPIESGRDEKRFDKAWRRFAEVCRSLHRDGLAYDVQFNLAGNNPHVLITASGTAKQRKH